MKRFISALAFCVSVLFVLSIFLFPPAAAKENALLTLLNLPAPPPPNPFVNGGGKPRDQKFYDKNNPPRDSAAIGEILDYWGQRNNLVEKLRYNPEPSDRIRDRLMSEIDKNPKLLPGYLNILAGDAKAPDFVKGIYDREGTSGLFEKGERKTIKDWLVYNSPLYSSDLERLAQHVSDSDEYVTNQDELLALTRTDFDKARPIIDRLYGDASLKTARVLARWALYRHALETGSTGDIDRYRDELKEVVEDKSALPGMRDLAMDALSSEKEWTGRDEWYFSLLGDETLRELRVNGTINTGLTTLILVSPDDKYTEKMLELVRSDNPSIRAAAVRNLVLKLNTNNPEIIKALLPWLENPKWAIDTNDARGTLVRQLSENEIRESVPGLIKILDESQQRNVYANAANKPANSVYYSSNVMANAANTMANAANAMAAADGTISRLPPGRPPDVVSYGGTLVDAYPYRSAAVSALTKQKDSRAVPALRRILPEGESYERGLIVAALLACNGFTVTEQLDAFETAAKGVRDEIDGLGLSSNANIAANSWGDPQSSFANQARPRINSITAAEIKMLLAQQLMQATEISDAMARGAVDRIEVLDRKDPSLARAYRRIILKWQNAAINILLLRDLKRGIADADTIVRLLGQRKSLREQQSTDIFDIRTGKPTAIGIAACLLEDTPDYTAILDGGNAEAKTALLACARLIRAPLPVAKVAASLKSGDELLKIAAERYLESEDSPEARSIVLSLHPNEAKILGARTAFAVDGVAESASEYLYAVYQSLGNDSLYNGWYGSENDGEIIAAEKRLQAEVKKDAELAGVYAFDGNYVRIYKDRVMFSWDEDESRYRERPLSKYEFDELKAYLTANKVDEMPPFISCGGGYCSAKELVMVGRGGGRRVYMNGGFGDTRGYEFFTGLEKYFAGLKQSPATLKYQLSREIPGLEIVMASDDLHAETVWKDGPDLRIVASATAVRKKVTAEIENLDEAAYVDFPEENVAKMNAVREKRRFEGFAWYKVVGGSFEFGAAQPPQVEFIPTRDGLAVQPSDEQWKTRAAGFEIRASADGLFKLVNGKLRKLRAGNYSKALVTPDGRWVFATKAGENAPGHVARIDLFTNKEYLVMIEGYGEYYPSVFVPGLNKVLIARDDNYAYEYGYAAEEEDDNVPNDADPDAMILVDPATGAMTAPPGEFRPLGQQTFRPLQKMTKPNEFWAAMPDAEKNETQVGVYNMRSFAFRPVLRVPKIKFNSMSMWVDEPGGKVYFVYRGHLLALPLNK